MLPEELEELVELPDELEVLLPEELVELPEELVELLVEEALPDELDVAGGRVEPEDAPPPPQPATPAATQRNSRATFITLAREWRIGQPRVNRSMDGNSQPT